MNERDKTKKQRLEAILQDAISSTLEILDEVPDSARIRDLRSKAQSYRLAVDRWAAVRPSMAQRDALRELVLELHTHALEAHESEAATPVQVRSTQSPTRD